MPICINSIKVFPQQQYFGKWMLYIQFFFFFYVRRLCFKGNLCAICLTSMWTEYDWNDVWWNQTSQKDQQIYPKIAEICSTAYCESWCFVEDLTVFLFQFYRISTTRALYALSQYSTWHYCVQWVIPGDKATAYFTASVSETFSAEWNSAKPKMFRKMYE